MKIWKVDKKDVVIHYGKNIILKNASVSILDMYGEVSSFVKKDMRIPLHGGFDMIVNYDGYPGEFYSQGQYLSVDDILKGLPPVIFNNKIVVFGVTDPNMNGDIWPSPLGQMPGVEHLAWALNTILTGRYLYEITPVGETLSILLLCIILSLLIQVMKPSLILPSLPLFLLVLYCVDIFVFSVSKYILHYWTLLLSVLFVYPVQIFWRFYTKPTSVRLGEEKKVSS